VADIQRIIRTLAADPEHLPEPVRVAWLERLKELSLHHLVVVEDAMADLWSDDLAITMPAARRHHLTSPEFTIRAEVLQEQVHRMAEAVGFTQDNATSLSSKAIWAEVTREAEQIGLVASELLMNLQRADAFGVVIVRPLREGGRTVGIEIISSDVGLGISDFAQAVAKHGAEGDGRMSGLAWVAHVMDDLQYRRGSRGSVIIARKWLPGKRTSGPTMSDTTSAHLENPRIGPDTNDLLDSVAVPAVQKINDWFGDVRRRMKALKGTIGRSI